MDLYLIRHPAVAVAPQTCYGASDVPLAAPVDADAARLRALLPPDGTLYASPLTRARRLAEALGTPTIDARLREIDFGAWEQQHFDAIGAAALDAWAADPLDHRPPGGESARDMAQRVLAFLAEVTGRDAAAPLVIVAHGGPLRVIAGHLLGLPAERWIGLDFAYARLTQLAVAPWGASLKRFNI